MKRRNFLKQFAVLAAGTFAWTKFGIAKQAITTMKDSPIILTKQLGSLWDTRDPFLFCAYHEDFFPKGNDNFGPVGSLEGRNIGNDFTVKDGYRMYHGATVPGFPAHPHRGFETVTITKKGLIDHSDSLGAKGRYGDGDVQWLTSGKGIQHAEMFPLFHKEKENPLELFQVWMNLPAKDKFVEPDFTMLWKEKIPLIKETDSNNRTVEIDLISGKYKGKTSLNPTPNSWAANPENEVCILTIKMEAHSKMTLPKASKDANRTLYFYRGNEIKINDNSLSKFSMAEVKPDQDLEIIAGKEDCYIMMLQGKPINEPVAQYGPFVMNTQAEINTAMSDFRKTQFGGWPWKSTDVVHDRKKGRFATFANGKTETPS